MTELGSGSYAGFMKRAKWRNELSAEALPTP